MFMINSRNNRIIKLLIIIVTILSLVNLIDYRVNASKNKKNIVLLLDNSGSMNSSQNKIGNLAKVAGSMLLDSIKEDEVNISIITFGEKVTILKHLDKEMGVEQLKDLLNNVQFNESKTNVKDGLKTAIEELNKFNENKSIIILSDGQEDPIGGLTEEHKNELNKLVDKAAESNIKINTIALSDDVDNEFLSNVASNTKGLFREGKTANKLFEALTSIIGEENDFVVIENYTTDLNKEKNIELGSMVEEVIINVAACDNQKPQIKIKLNNKLVEPYKCGDMYYVYRFDMSNKENSNLSIVSSGTGVSSVIVQFKSKVKIKMNNNMNNYISIPRNVPIDINLLLDSKGMPIEEGVFLQCSNGEIIEPNGIKGVYSHSFSSDIQGENIVRYTAKDSQNGIIAVLDIVVNINEYPPFYYDNLQESLIQGDNLDILIKLKDNTQISQLSGELIIKQGEKSEELPLEVKGTTLSGKVKVNGSEDIKYYANIRGIINETGNSFAYDLPTINLKVQEKPTILLEYMDIKKCEFIKEKENTIHLNLLKESVITESTMVSVFDNKNNNIGNFQVDKDTKGIINVKIRPVEKGKNIELVFKTNNSIEVTKKLKTNINVYSYIGLIFNRTSNIIVYFILPIVITIFIVLVIYFIFDRRYREEVEEFKFPLNIEYTVSPNGNTDIISEFLSKDRKKLYLNINKKNNHITLDEEPINPLGCFQFKNKYEQRFKVIQGAYNMVEKEKMFTAIYESYEEINDGSISSRIKYESGITIPYKIGKKKIDIDF